MGQTMNPHWPGYDPFGWLDEPAYHSGEKQKRVNRQKMNGAFHRASAGGRSLERETRRREKEMLKKAREAREEREWREKDIERAVREAQEEREKGESR